MHSVCVPQRFRISQMCFRLDCARQNSAAQARVHVHLHRILGTALILPRIQGGATLLHSRALRPATCGCSPLSPSRCWPGSRATEFRVIIVTIVEPALSRGRRSAYPTLGWGLTAHPRLVARPLPGIKKSQPFYRLSAERLKRTAQAGGDALRQAGRRTCAVEC